MHEAQIYAERTPPRPSSFITLTYDDEHLPADQGLDIRHWQLFAKRVRKSMGDFRFLHCGEYGDELGRPHYHAAIFGQDWHHDRRTWYDTFTSATLEAQWGKGIATVDDLTFSSAAYVAKYVMKKANGETAAERYGDLKPEYASMSLKPGLGFDWFTKYGDEVYPDDQVVINGQATRPPRYYDKLYEATHPEEMRAIKRARIDKVDPADQTPERLRQRETVTKAKLNQHPRHL